LKQNRSIEQLDISIRLANIIARAVAPRDFQRQRKLPRARTLEDLCAWTRGDVRALPNMGKRSFEELQAVMKDYGFSLREEFPKTCRKRNCKNVVDKEGLVCDRHRCAHVDCPKMAVRLGRCKVHASEVPLAEHTDRWAAVQQIHAKPRRASPHTTQLPGQTNPPPRIRRPRDRGRDRPQASHPSRGDARPRARHRVPPARDLAPTTMKENPMQQRYVYSLDGEHYQTKDDDTGWETREEALSAGRERARTLASLKELEPGHVWTGIQVGYEAAAFFLMADLIGDIAERATAEVGAGRGTPDLLNVIEDADWISRAGSARPSGRSASFLAAGRKGSPGFGRCDIAAGGRRRIAVR
jgi:hypothetical protein